VLDALVVGVERTPAQAEPNDGRVSVG
jgi:hypothetical protein